MKKNRSFEIQKPFRIPSNLSICFNGTQFLLQGPLGTNVFNANELDKHANLGFQIESGRISFYKLQGATLQHPSRPQKTKKSTSHVSFKSNLEARLDGITCGFLKTLHLVGTGYRVRVIDKLSNILILRLGTSKDIVFRLPKGILAHAIKTTKVCFFSIDYQELTQVCAQIKALKKPDPYKGKGVLEENQIVELKLGKRK
jgi:large subunit ribosomal protein L6